MGYINGTLGNQHKEKDRILNRKMGKHCGQAITKEEIQLAKQWRNQLICNWDTQIKQQWGIILHSSDWQTSENWIS